MAADLVVVLRLLEQGADHGAARFHQARSIVLVGHVLDVPGFRDAIERIPLLDRSYVRIVSEPGFAVARGALETALRDGHAGHA